MLILNGFSNCICQHIIRKITSTRTRTSTSQYALIDLACLVHANIRTLLLFIVYKWTNLPINPYWTMRQNIWAVSTMIAFTSPNIKRMQIAWELLPSVCHIWYTWTLVLCCEGTQRRFYAVFRNISCIILSKRWYIQSTCVRAFQRLVGCFFVFFFWMELLLRFVVSIVSFPDLQWYYYYYYDGT